jgi:flagellar basal-body rod modification protein FlgD
MQIQNQALTSNPLAETPASSGGNKNGTTPTLDSFTNANTFLQLLVAQLKNQDPLQPADSVQFLTQLAQFSQLEQLIGIRQDLKKAEPQPVPGASAPEDSTKTESSNKTE